MNLKTLFSKHFVKTPLVLQMEAVECGAAALSIIMSYYGRYVTLEALRLICGVSRDGSKAGNIVRAAKSYGFESYVFEVALEDLDALEAPFIVFWGFNHFLVVEGFGKEKVYLNDPASGRRTVSLEEFSRSYTGVVISVMPTEKFQVGGSKPTFLPALLRRLKNQKMILLFLILTGVSLVIPGILIPVLSKTFIDSYLVGNHQQWLMPLFLGLLFTILTTGLFTWVQEYYLLRFRTKLALTSSAHFFWHVLCLPMLFYSQRYAGDIAYRVDLNTQIARLLSNDLIQVILSMITVLFFLILMFSYSWILTLVSVSIALINMLLLWKVTEARVNLTKTISIETGKLAGVLMGNIYLIETLKSSGMENSAFASLTGRLANLVSQNQVIGRINERLLAVTNLLPTLNIVAVLGTGGYLIIISKITVGTLVAFQSLAMSFMLPFQQFVQVGTCLQEMQGNMNRVDDVLHYPAEVIPLETQKTEEVAYLTGRVEFRDVTFGFNQLEPPLFENLSFIMEPGRWLGVMGASRSGRSTIANLLIGLVEPWSGEILIDGKPRSFYTRETLAVAMGFASQEVTLFDGTIRDNLTLWDTTIAEQDVVAAAKDAEVHSVILARSGAYDAMINGSAANFSGGERQRLEIARALVYNPTLLVLDSAMSSLDGPLEKRVLCNLRRRPFSLLIIAHRLSSLRECDDILVLDKGKIVAQGSHEKLMQDKEGLYAKMMGME